ncbi:MAG: histidinol-phosphatase [Lachnospiraceae bacterium]|nr:histidinol-phosphatase [Lachnospiraceae bacterium]
MKANYHTHTKRCQHASGEDREYVEAAIEAGYRVLGFSDHCPWVYPNDYVSNIRMRPSEVDGYFASLEGLREEYKSDIQLLIGYEAEYIPVLMEAQDRFFKDYPLDYMILGQHFVGEEHNHNYAGAETDSVEMLRGYVDLCIEGMKSGRYQYLAHPDLIYYTGDTKIYEREMKRLCEAMNEIDAVIEMNILGLAIGRNYPDNRFWRIAKETGNRVILGMDAHSPQQFADLATVEKAKRMCQGMDVAEELVL